jgi:hypothetical protein
MSGNFRFGLNSKPRRGGRRPRTIKPYSRELMIASLDQRTREAGYMRQVRNELTEHVGGKPNAVQRALIERAVILSLRVAQLDRKILAGEEFTIHDSNYSLAWNNALRRTLMALGVEGATAGKPDPLAVLRQHIETRQKARPAGAAA